MILEGFSRVEIRRIVEDLPYEEKKMSDSFKYLGFHLNPDLYRIQDWFWLVTKIENRIKH